MHVEYFVLTPKLALRELGRNGNELAAFLARRPLLWRSKLPRLRTPGDAGNLARLKILFVLEVWSSYEGDENLKGLEEGGLSLNTFDRWWTLEPIAFPETAEAVERGIPVECFQRFSNTGDEWVDGWLERMRQKSEGS